MLAYVLWGLDWWMSGMTAFNMSQYGNNGLGEGNSELHRSFHPHVSTAIILYIKFKLYGVTP